MLREQALSKLGPATNETAQAVSQAARPAAPAIDQATGGDPFAPLPNTPQVPNRQPGRGFDLDLPDVGGGGAIDPISAAIGLSLAGAGALAAQRKKKAMECGDA